MRILMFIVFGLISLASYAYDFEVDGLGYSITSMSKMECKVVSLEDKSIAEVEVPDFVTYSNRKFRVTSLGYAAFSDCGTITKVTIGENIIEIGAAAFVRSTALREVYINSALDKLGYSAFKGCTSLASVEIQSCASLGDSMFDGCTSLESVKIQSGTSFGNYIFNGCTSLESVEIQSCTSFGKYMFNGCTALTSFVCPDSLQNIPEYLFCDCTSLANVQLSSSITSIGDGAFKNCAALKEIRIPAKVLQIGNYAFEGCSALGKLVIEESEDILNLGYLSVKTVSTYPFKYEYSGLFEDCPIKSLTIGRSLEFKSNLYFNASVDNYYPPFNRQSLDELIILPSTRVLAENLFYGCSLNGELSILDSSIPLFVHRIVTKSKDGKEEIYNNFSKFEPSRIYIGRDVQEYYNDYYINKWDLGGNNLEYYEIGDKVTTGYPIVKSPVKLREVVIGAACIKENFCKDAKQLTDLEIGPTVIEIGSDAFARCDSLKRLTLPKSVEKVHDYAFRSCKDLEEIDIYGHGCDITNGFIGCSSLKYIRLHGNAPDAREVCFEASVYMNCILEVPSEEFENIKSTAPWSIFWNIRSSDNLLRFFVKDGLRFYYWTTENGENLAELQASLHERQNVVIPESITVKNVEYSVISIANKAFADDDTMRSLTIPHTVQTIGDCAFNGCTNIEDLRILDSNEPLYFGKTNKRLDSDHYVGYADYYGVSLSLGVAVDKGPFYACQLKTLYIGRNVSYEIMNYSLEAYKLTEYGFASPFSDQPVRTINVGSNVSSFCTGAPVYPLKSLPIWDKMGSFIGCKNIISIHSLNSNPPAEARFSESTYQNATLIVPDNSVPLYKAAEGWKDFLNIIDESSAASVEDINVPVKNENFFVYNLQGIMILETKDIESIKQLPPGIYIVNGKKMAIR